MKYPEARQSNAFDDYHGVRVCDPYRWLEDPDSPETVAWVEGENQLTRSVVDGPRRDALITRLTTLYDFPRTSVPARRGRYYFFTHNTGLQDQPVLFVQEGAAGERRALIDPNAMSADGPVALTALAIDDSGELAAYGLSKSGSDRQEIFIRRIADGTDLSDRLLWVKFASIAWVKDGSGFYYTRFPEPGTVAPGDENYFNKVYYHRLGDNQSLDHLIFEQPNERETVFGVEVSDNDRWVVITAFKGSSDRSEVYAIDRRADSRKPVPLFTGFLAAYAFIESAADKLLFRTDDRAPRGRIVSVDPLNPQGGVTELVAESSDKLSSAAVIHRTIVAAYMHNASDALRMFTVAGEPAGQVDLPEIGSLTGVSGRPEDDDMFFGFTSFVHPAINYRYDFKVRQLEPFGDRSTWQCKSDEYGTSQVWYPSKDGTLISMFLVSRKGLPKDGKRPVLLTGYGGFNISLTPAFDPSNFVLLEKGGIYAVPNLRGGGEYGEAWHEAGMFERKQNVFDDFIAAAEWLVASGYTNPRQIAIEGGSNGGLLTAAVMLQRPDLFGAVLSRVPVADMLRYHRFTVGRFWISEYGSADDPEQFPFLYRYSPLHNVVNGTPYPPILITTADTDDRVAPGMAKKFAARLQAAGHTAPVLIRVETKAGHGAGKPLSKTIEEDADIFSFIFGMLGID
ncbi:MAG TPA: prolyl oligopeptidase family serine peptidase [Vicinamibacterales bacterium]|nr:prolyl oligopeptidase family serine peptidase [Vicinamibacterales bacterium]